MLECLSAIFIYHATQDSGRHIGRVLLLHLNTGEKIFVSPGFNPLFNTSICVIILFDQWQVSLVGRTCDQNAFDAANIRVYPNK